LQGLVIRRRLGVVDPGEREGAGTGELDLRPIGLRKHADAADRGVDLELAERADAAAQDRTAITGRRLRLNRQRNEAAGLEAQPCGQELPAAGQR
jgi:hypothetical protein